jgi:hypothetical protein
MAVQVEFMEIIARPDEETIESFWIVDAELDDIPAIVRSAVDQNNKYARKGSHTLIWRIIKDSERNWV